MVCPSCKNELDDSNKFCPHCGADLNKKDNNSNNSTNNNTDDEKFVEAYVGKNYEKIKNNHFSIPAFFLGPVYFMYRKLYLYVLVYFFVTLFLGPLMIIMNLFIIPIFFSKLYLQDVRTKVANLKIQNRNMSEEELLDLCSKKGGVSLAAAMIYEVVAIILVGILAVLFYFMIKTAIDEIDTSNSNSEFDDIFDQYIGTDEEDDGETGYEYNRTGEIGVNTVIRYIVPDKYKRLDDNVESYLLQSGNTRCTFNAGLIKENKEAEPYIREESDTATIDKRGIGEIEFTTGLDNKGDLVYNYYAVNYDSMLYVFSFSDANDDKEICANNREKLLNSMEVVKVNEEENYSNLKNISYSEFNNLTGNFQTFIILFSKSTCPHCKSFKPKLNKVLSEHNLSAYVLDLDMISQDDYNDLSSKIYFHSTPTTIFINKGVELDIGTRLIGDVPEEKIIEKLKALNYIESEKAMGSSV